MLTVKFWFTSLSALAFSGALLGCAPVHDAKPQVCPAGQEPSGGLCVCSATNAAPVDEICPTSEAIAGGG
jgi:hypothetical protein